MAGQHNRTLVPCSAAKSGPALCDPTVCRLLCPYAFAVPGDVGIPGHPPQGGQLSEIQSKSKVHVLPS